jgi:hypothetical protein
MAQVSFAFGGFAGQNVAGIWLLVLQTATSRGFKALGGAPMSFDFGHVLTSLTNPAPTPSSALFDLLLT